MPFCERAEEGPVHEVPLIGCGVATRRSLHDNFGIRSDR